MATSFQRINTTTDRNAMKKIISLLVLLPFLAAGQTTTQNFVKTTKYKTAVTSPIATPTATQAVQAVTYYDGLGRPIQQVAGQMSGSGKDIVTHIEYDALGRQAKQYLPYPGTGTDLGYLSGARDAILGYTDYSGQSPFSEKVFEPSSLNRVLKQAAPGSAWAMGQGNEIEYLYQANSASVVRIFRANATSSGGLYSIALSQTGNTYYPAGALYKQVVQNENWVSGTANTTEEFKDKEGRVVLKRTYGLSKASLGAQPAFSAHDTYYVYDQYGNLTYVIPPKVNTATNPTSVLNELCYQYKYDYRNRMVEKKLPGKQWEFIVYDKADRIVESGPVLSPFGDGANGWMVTHYDALNRVAFTGWYAATVSEAARANEQTTQSGLAVINVFRQSPGTIDGITAGYSNAVAPATIKLLSVNYYDDYGFPTAPGSIPATVMTDYSQPVYYNATVKPKGLPTGSWIRALEGTGAVNGEAAYVLYDRRARPVRVYSANYLGDYTYTDSTIDFSGKTLFSETRHKRVTSSNEIYVKDTYTYTAQDRLDTHTHKVGLSGTPQLLAKNAYNERGQLIGKKTGGTDASAATFYQNVNYSYNIRGWLTGINNVGNLTQLSDPKDLFAFQINYENPHDDTPGLPEDDARPMYNGNISQVYWKTSGDDRLRMYAFAYDEMNRLTYAYYQKDGTYGPNSFGEGALYDKNGNTLTMDRFGMLDDWAIATPIDDLSYYYQANSNKLMKVTDGMNDTSGFDDDSDGTNDTADDYSYDLMGNLLTDQNKGITSIKYNHLNLPVEITFNNDVNTKITYLYDAAGKKLKKAVSMPDSQTVGGVRVTVTDYIGGFQYVDTVLKFFPTSEGYVSNTVSGGNNIYSYVFNYTDHLGNVRLSYSKVGSILKILEENHYYPYGLKHNGYNLEQSLFMAVGGELGVVQYAAGGGTTPPAYNYKFNGKEWQDELGLNMTALDYRQYDNAIGRFNVVDPLAEQDYSQTPYHFANGNPVFWADPSGLRSNSYDYYFDGDGRRKRDRMGLFIAPFERSQSMSDGGFDSSYYAAEGAFYTEPVTGYRVGGGAKAKGIMVSSNSMGMWIGHFVGYTQINKSDKEGIKILGIPNYEYTFEPTDHWFDVKADIGSDLLRFKGFHKGVPEFETSLLKSAAMTPGPFVLYPSGESTNPYLNTHEPGHVLQFLMLGFLYYPLIAVPSMTHVNDPNSNTHYHESIANELWYLFSGERHDSNPFYSDEPFKF
jgi:RHS repeat-associated protein